MTKKRLVTPDDYAWPHGITVSATPVRRIHTRARRRNTALVYSTLPLGMREVESSVEERFARVAQLDPGVSRLRSQPSWLRVAEHGRIRRRAPDFAVMYDGRAELHEVKQDAECWDPEVASELLAVRTEVERHAHWRYSVSLESALLAEPLASNTDLLWRHLRPEHQLDYELRLRVDEVVSEDVIPAGIVLDRVRRRGMDIAWQDLLSLIAGRLIDFDVAVPLNLDSLLWNRFSGPARARMLPFGSVESAIAVPPPTRPVRPFLSVQLRGVRL
jgi:hypothetical protein